MRNFIVGLLACASLLLIVNTVTAEVVVSSPDVSGWFESMEEAADEQEEGSNEPLCPSDETMVYYRLCVTLDWSEDWPDCRPEEVKLKMYEDDLGSDDFIGNGEVGESLGGSIPNPIDPTNPFPPAWKVTDFICTSGADLAEKGGYTHEPGWYWELEVRICYDLDDGNGWQEVDPAGYEQDQEIAKD